MKKLFLLIAMIFLFSQAYSQDATAIKFNYNNGEAYYWYFTDVDSLPADIVYGSWVDGSSWINSITSPYTLMFAAWDFVSASTNDTLQVILQANLGGLAYNCDTLIVRASTASTPQWAVLSPSSVGLKYRVIGLVKTTADGHAGDNNNNATLKFVLGGFKR